MDFQGIPADIYILNSHTRVLSHCELARGSDDVDQSGILMSVAVTLMTQSTDLRA